MRSVGLYTLGCKVSQYETEAIGEAFEARGFTVMPFDSVCDAYVINTCTVTAESDRKSRQIIRRAIKKNPVAVVAVVGCYSQRSPDELLEMDGVDIVLGTDKKLEVVDRVEFLLDNPLEKPYCSIEDLDKADFELMTITKAPRTRAYVKIEDGCESKCTYCAISSARGRVRSKLPEEVIREVEGLYKNGTREIVLTGIETGSYGKDFDFNYTLADLIVELDKRGSCERIRLGSLAPELIGKSFVDKVKGVKILAPHFHLSIQSGSDNVLKAMKRRYSRAMALANISYIRENIPAACFTTDLMVGFPGETDEDFLDTVSFVREARFIDAHVFAYSKRKGTPAATYPDQVDEGEKKRRSARLIAVKNEVRDSVLDGIVKLGEPLSAVLETPDGEYYSAHSDSFVEIKVKAKEGMQGEIVDVIPVSHSEGIIMAKLK